MLFQTMMYWATSGVCKVIDYAINNQRIASFTVRVSNKLIWGTMRYRQAAGNEKSGHFPLRLDGKETCLSRQSHANYM